MCIGRARPSDLDGAMLRKVAKWRISQWTAPVMKELVHSAAFWAIVLSPIVFDHGPNALRLGSGNLDFQIDLVDFFYSTEYLIHLSLHK